MTTTYYVKAQADGLFAACSYFTDPECKEPVKGSRLVIPPTADACEIAEAQGSELALLGAAYKTLGHEAVMTDHNFNAAVAGAVSVGMPTTSIVTKGVILIFSDRGTVKTLYPSDDPEVTNGEQ
ncbi:MAG TPA: hypothetical protein VGF12_07535 [Roseateles sp.]|uniref:hypothetical protein n=1 Tax=Roseateles sp. TaxID=1971397 RepID=UPI002ED9262A